MTGSKAFWRALVFETVRAPGSAARTILQLHPSREALWTALVLVGVLNTILFTLTNIVAPVGAPVPAALTNPMIILGIVVGGIMLSAIAILLSGRALGGKGTLSDILLLMIWLQALRVLVQGAMLILLFIDPSFAVAFIMAVNVLSIWILLHFVNAAHHLDSLMRSAGVLVAAVIGLSLILSLLGISILGSAL
ncbi:MAG: YIP1 family protein [Paracoccaceae bacterium]